jgi:Asp-tRNA(Asn)/Glu-tRNA(Gln) amidotransferase A subunit family amidase
MAWLHLTSALTVTGHPVVSLPAGLDSNGLPFGIQLVGPMYQDHKLLSMAKAVEQMGSSSERFKQPQ